MQKIGGYSPSLGQCTRRAAWPQPLSATRARRPALSPHATRCDGYLDTCFVLSGSVDGATWSAQAAAVDTLLTLRLQDASKVVVVQTNAPSTPIVAPTTLKQARAANFASALVNAPHPGTSKNFAQAIKKCQASAQAGCVEYH